MPDPAPPAGHSHHPTSTLDTVRACWTSALGSKGAGAGARLLHMSVGMKRILRLQQLLAERTGAAIPVSTLLQLGTQQAIAAAVQQGRWPAHCPCVTLRDGAPGRQLFIVPAAGGVILELCALALAVPFDGQVLGLQTPGVDGETEPLAQVEALASRFVATVLAQRAATNPPASVALVGYSFSGLVVIEMARQLRALGVQPQLVAVIDTTTHPRFWPRREALRFALKRTRLRLERLRAMPPAAAWAFAGDSLRACAGLLGRLRIKTAAAPPSVQASAYYVGGLPPALQALRNACILAYEAYRPTPLAFPLLLFKSQQGDPHACDPAGLWAGLAPQLEVRVVPGSHTTMLRQPHVRQLAAELGTRLC